MKSIVKFFLLVTVFSTMACDDDFLDRNPKDEYSNSSLWSSESDARAALNGTYNGWTAAYDVIYMDCASDNAYNRYPWEGYTEFGNGTVSAESNNAQDRWDYSTIQRCNWFLENISETPMNEELKERFKAEARFLRAYNYFTLTQLYGAVPLVEMNISIEEANEISKTSKNDVQNFILNELAEIATILPQSYDAGNVGHVTKGAAYALSARIELYRENYDEAISQAEEVMSLGYSLYPSYSDLFRIQHEDNNEIILDIQHIQNNYSLDILGVMPSIGFGGWGSINPTQDLVDAYEMQNGKAINDPSSGFNPNDPYANRDPRLEATIVVPGQLYEGKYYNSIEPSSVNYYNQRNNSLSGYIVKKYTAQLSDYDDMWNTGLNIPLIRYAEILLTYAEAKIESGDIDQSVFDAINQVRSRADMPQVDETKYNDQSSLRELIRRERRVELALEGLRWFDIQRWEIGPETMNKTIYGTRLGTVNPENGNLNLEGEHVKVEERYFDPGKNYLWPIPQKEIDVNDNLDQNPGF